MFAEPKQKKTQKNKKLLFILRLDNYSVKKSKEASRKTTVGGAVTLHIYYPDKCALDCPVTVIKDRVPHCAYDGIIKVKKNYLRSQGCNISSGRSFDMDFLWSRPSSVLI